MRKNTVLYAMAKEFLDNFANSAFLLVSMEKREKLENDGTQKTGTRCLVELPRGCGAYSRKRFTVTVWGIMPTLSEDDFDDADYDITFSDLEITFVDGNGEVYGSAMEFKVAKAD